MPLFRPLPMQTGGRPSPSRTGGVHDRLRTPVEAVQLHLHHHAGHVREPDVRPSGAVGRGGREIEEECPLYPILLD